MLYFDIFSFCSNVAKYASDFRTLTVESGWDNIALKAVFHQGLNSKIIKELVCRDDEATLDGLINLAIRLDNVLLDRLAQVRPVYSTEPSNPKPMQIDGTHLPAQERQRRCCEYLCFYCGGADHIILQCHMRSSRCSVLSGARPKLHKLAVSAK